MINLGYSFYHKIADVSDVDFGDKIVGRSEKRGLDLQTGFFEIDGAFRLNFTIIYPGLAIGLGYEHPKKEKEKEKEKESFALGFMFDHTTGLPYIPGSGVKGVIRSAFPKSEQDEGRLEFVNGILGKKRTYAEIEEIENQIFGSRTGRSGASSRLCQDTFYDGYVSEIASGPLLGEEYVTPHGEDVISEPVPIKFLKIMPGNEITLQFALNRHSECLLSFKERRALFAEIILALGLGAKTNVGFGQFDYDFTKQSLKAQEKEENEKLKQKKAQDIINNATPIDRVFLEHNNEIVKIIQKMQSENSGIDEDLGRDIAKRLKKMMEEKKIWTGQKKKSLKRVQYLKGLLGEQ